MQEIFFYNIEVLRISWENIFFPATAFTKHFSLARYKRRFQTLIVPLALSVVGMVDIGGGIDLLVQILL